MADSSGLPGSLSVSSALSTCSELVFEKLAVFAEFWDRIFRVVIIILEHGEQFIFTRKL